jgi:RNA polymerase sigma factor (sigma-70 family)
MTVTGGTRVANRRLSSVLDFLRQLDGAGASDAELLESYVQRGDESAFEVIMRRHGAMVLGVCRRILDNEADAEDAFQATFLVLVSKAGSIRPRSLVGNWLFGVARSTALKAREMNNRRHAKEQEAGRLPRPETPSEHRDQLQTLLDEELSNLPAKYRVPVILCELESKSIKEAACQLGWPQGTVASRLSRARVLLGKRLARRGAALVGGSLAAAFSHYGAVAAVPRSLLTTTMRAASLFAAGRAASAHVISTKVAALAQGVMKGMLIRKLLLAAALLPLLAIAVPVTGRFLLSAAGGDVPERPTNVVSKGQPPPLPNVDGLVVPKQLEQMTWHLVAVDDARRTISLNDRTGFKDMIVFVHNKPSWFIPLGLVLSDLAVSPDAEILLDGKKAGLRDLKAGMQLSLRWMANRTTIAQIEAISAPPPLSYRLDDIDIENNTVSVSATESPLKLAKVPVTRDAVIQMMEMLESREVFRWGRITLKDLRSGMIVALDLTTEDGLRIAVKRIIAGKGTAP